MPGQIDDHAMADFADFIDTVSKLITAVLDMNGGIVMRHVATIHIGNSWHGYRTCRLEILDRDAEHLLDMAHRSCRCEDHDTVLGLDLGVAIRTDHGLVAVDRAD